MASTTKRPRIALAGNPNAGKTTLFNALTGLRARTGNYPGITVERRVAEVTLGGRDVEIVDVPGTYSLSSRSAEEQIAVDELLPRVGPAPDLVVVVADAGALARHLYFAIQVLETGLPVVLALNMMDEAETHGVRVDHEALARLLGVRVVPVVGSRRRGIDALERAIAETLASPARTTSLELRPLAPEHEAAVDELAALIVRLYPTSDDSDSSERDRALASWALLSLGHDELVGVAPELRARVDELRASTGHAIDDALVARRYAKVDEVVAAAVTVEPRGPKLTRRVDAILTHPLWGFLVFALVMAALFQALFSWSEPFVAGIEGLVELAKDLVRGALPEGPVADLLADGVVAGVGNVVVFVPQIALLSLFIVFLEDSGYLARVAFVIDRVMGAVGLHGRAFVPLLSGFACAVPAVLATRTIENRRDRLVTMLALPLMSCSARLPVYTLMIAVVFPPGSHGWLGLEAGAIALFAMYALSVGMTLFAAWALKKTVLPGPRPPLVLELPPYRLPLARNVASTVFQRTREFVWNAGTVILAITVVLWGLLSFPRDADREQRYEARIAAASAATAEGEDESELTATLEHERDEARMAESFAGRFGRAIEPAIAPLGFDWKIGIGLIASFAAREVLVSTLGLVYGVGEVDETDDSLRSRLREARRPDGSQLFTPLTGISLMVFFVLAAQCMSTLAIVRRESGGWKWPMFMLVYMNALAYVASLAIFQVGTALGY